MKQASPGEKGAFRFVRALFEPNITFHRTRKNGAPVKVGVRRHRHNFAERGNIAVMRVTTGKVIGGKVVVEGVPLEEGAVVTVLARESEETFRLSPEEEAELLLSIEEADRGETVSLEEVLEKLPGPRP